MRNKTLAVAAVLLTAGCYGSVKTVSGTVEYVGSGVTGGGTLESRFDHRYIKLKDDDMYDCRIDIDSRCGAIHQGMDVTLYVQDYGDGNDVHGVAFTKGAVFK